jgi:hypothetical protein
MKINKESFISIMNGIEKSRNNTKGLDKYLSEDLLNDVIEEPFYLLMNFIKDLCNDNTKYSWIDYYVYELDWGKNYKTGCVTSKNKKPIDISTLDKLYKFLKKNYEDNEKIK